MARIIIADDDEMVVRILEDVLGKAGHVVGALDNGADALTAITIKRPDLVILDCNMPRMNGLLVLREMRANSALYRTPVLILTGRQSSRDVQLAYNQGAQGYLKKPFDPDELVFKVGDLLESKARAAA